MHRIIGILIQHGVGGNKSGCGTFTVSILDSKANGLDDIFDAGTGSAVTGGAFQALLVTLDRRLVVSQGILQKITSKHRWHMSYRV